MSIGLRPGAVALVTGAGQRVGQAIAIALAAAGARVAIHYRESRSGAEATLAAVREVGSDGFLVRADLADGAAAAPLITEVVATAGRLDLLVNSAAAFERVPLDAVDAAAWDRAFAVNARAPFLLAVAAARAMGAEGGAIISLSDHLAHETSEAYLVHGLSKSVVEAMTRQLARQFAPQVRINAIAPGFILAPPGMSEATIAHFASTTPLQRNGAVEDVVAAVLALATAPYVTGVVLPVDGGRHLGV
ncbi:MAG: SDR family oxidoreductase [Gemmatimonadaceae bacterium]|nr:SDR family oxidoreductase [Gemmatimonadaceae bacterium]